MLTAADFHPPRLLRNPHLQSVLGSSALRQRRGLRALAASGARTRELILDGGNGVRLQGWHSQVPGIRPRGMALLLHGWEGSAESGYMRLTAARLLQAGCDVFRLNFRDHGPTHHLNEAVFHSCRLDEVVNAALDVPRRWPGLPLLLAGFSLGGNFALRVAMAAPGVGLPLRHVAAVCPALDPERTTRAMETGLPLYQRYFVHKWTRSLRRKRALFPRVHDFDDAALRFGVREITEWLVRRGGEFADADAYFDGYRISEDRLAALQVPADILTSRDDPVIPVEDFHRLQLPATARVEIADDGGHCGFLLGARLDGYAEAWVERRLLTALERAPAQTSRNDNGVPA